MGESDILTSSVEDCNNFIVQPQVEDPTKKCKDAFLRYQLSANNIFDPASQEIANSLLVPLVVKKESSSLQMTPLNNLDSIGFDVAGRNMSNAKLTSLTLGKVIALDENLEHLLQTPLSDSDVIEEKANEDGSCKLLRRVSSSSSSSSSFDDDDSDLASSDYWRKKPRIGKKHQVECIPDLKKQPPDYNTNDDHLLWSPLEVDHEQVEDFLKSTNSTSSSTQSDVLNSLHISDNEDALMLLVQCNHDVYEAARRYSFRSLPVSNELDVWSAEECNQFEHGMILYGKDFHRIHHNKVKTKSIGEIVKFYYLWKKTDRYKRHVKTRLGKKKEVATPDYVERLMDESGPPTPTQLAPPSPNSSNFPLLSAFMKESGAANPHPHHSPRSECVSRTSSHTDLLELIDEENYRGFTSMEPPHSPTPTDHDYSPASLAGLDPIIYVAYSDPDRLAPISSSLVEVPYTSDCELSVTDPQTIQENATLEHLSLTSVLPSVESCLASTDKSSFDTSDSVQSQSSSTAVSIDDRQVFQEEDVDFIESNCSILCSCSSDENDLSSDCCRLKTLPNSDEQSTSSFDTGRCRGNFSGCHPTFTDDSASSSGLSISELDFDKRITRNQVL